MIGYSERIPYNPNAAFETVYQWPDFIGYDWTAPLNRQLSVGEAEDELVFNDAATVVSGDDIAILLHLIANEELHECGCSVCIEFFRGEYA